jgi:thiaminase (transcriptional activator TenA)
LSRQLWGAIEDVYAAILEHPFLRGLTTGDLPRDAFLFYVIQDAHYLREYARALAVCAARAPTEADIRMFAEHAAEAIAVERELHEGFFADAGIDEAQVAATPMAPTCLAYTSYLLASVHGGSFAEGLGAVLPCYWIYQEVGVELARHGSPNELYQRWIDTYGGEEFAAVVRAVIDLTDRLEPELGPADTARMTERFRTTSRYEWMFWDMAWRREAWPLYAEPNGMRGSPSAHRPISP